MLLLTLDIGVRLNLGHLRLAVEQSLVESISNGSFMIIRVLKPIDMILAELRRHINITSLLIQVRNIDNVVIETTFFLGRL